MRHRLTALCLLGLLSATGAATAQSPVWALHGAHNTVYLAESVHLLKPGAAALPPAFEHAWSDSSVLVMELDLGHLDAMTLQSWIQEHGRLAGGTLQQVLGEQRYARVAASAAQLGLSPDLLQPLKPWVAAMMLTDLSYLKQGFDPDSGVEKQLLARPDAASHQTAGLESVDEELGQLDSLPLEDQARFLEQTLADLGTAEQDTDELIAAWRRGDNAALGRLLSEDYTGFPSLYDALVTRRNGRWMPELLNFLKGDHNYLVVVGALHVVGRDGLLDQLRKAGIKAEPVH